MSAPVGLSAIASWDLPRLRGAVGSLALVAERTTAWRHRLDELTRELARADCWSGPAASAAAEAMVELSTVTSAVEQSLHPSAAQLAVATTAADEAQELAASAQAAASVGPVSLRDDGTLVAQPAPATPVMAADQLAALDAQHTAGRHATGLAAAALTQALAVGTAAQAAGDALASVGVVRGHVWFGYAGLTAEVHSLPVVVPPPPLHAGATDAAAWFAGLNATQQALVIERDAPLIGRLDGLPAWARDEANRQLLADELADPTTGDRQATARTVAAAIADQEDEGRPVQLYQFDLDRDLVALATGDLDTADDIAVLVPGVGTTPADDMDSLANAADRIADAAEDAAPGASVAVLAWLGYRTPPNILSGTRSVYAQVGGPTLDRALNGIAANRADSPARVTVVAHSYGTVVLDHAADEDGELAADAVVLLGSPGIDERSAAGLEADEVYDAATPSDPISYLGLFGSDTWAPFFGATELPVDLDQKHSEYLDADRPTLAAIGEVVAGTRQ